MTTNFIDISSLINGIKIIILIPTSEMVCEEVRVDERIGGIRTHTYQVPKLHFQ